MASHADTTLIGGPLCGRYLNRIRYEPFLWITMLDDEQRTLRAFKTANPRGVLYRRAGQGESMTNPTYIYAALTHRRCEECDGVQLGMETCSFCGGRLLPA